MEDNRFDCHNLCVMTHDSNNKCDGHCLKNISGFGELPDYEERIQRAQEHIE